MNFNLTGTDALLGRGKEVIRFWWPWPYFQGHTSTLNVALWPKKSLSAPYFLNQMIYSSKTLFILSLGYLKDLIRFWWSWPNFHGHYTIKTVKMSLVCTLSPEPKSGLHQTCIETALWHGKEVIRFWWPWSYFRGHISTLNFKFCPKKACLHPISWNKWWILATLYVLYHWNS